MMSGKMKMAGGEVWISGGMWRGRKIKTPGHKTHPMGERERMALMNMIMPEIPGAVALDAFAGSGALGIELLSRGAAKVVFIENNPRAAQVIRQNLAALGAEGEVVVGSAGGFHTSGIFNIIVADPPYDDFIIAEVENLVQYLSDNGVFVLSHPGDAPDFDGLELIKTHTYARANISVYKRAY